MWVRVDAVKAFAVVQAGAGVVEEMKRTRWILGTS